MPDNRFPSFYRFLRGLLLFFTAGLLTVVQGREWEVWENVRLKPGSYADGDSFWVLYRGQEYVIRLYYVDTPETDHRFPQRIQDQADYFRISYDETILLGEKGADFAQKHLARPFTVITKRERVFDSNRIFGAIRTSSGEDFAMALVEGGLARVFGRAAEIPGYPPPDQFFRQLRSARERARARGLGGWSRQSGGIVWEDPSRRLFDPIRLFAPDEDKNYLQSSLLLVSQRGSRHDAPHPVIGQAVVVKRQNRLFALTSARLLENPENILLETLEREEIPVGNLFFAREADFALIALPSMSSGQFLRWPEYDDPAPHSIGKAALLTNRQRDMETVLLEIEKSNPAIAGTKRQIYLDGVPWYDPGTAILRGLVEPMRPGEGRFRADSGGDYAFAHTLIPITENLSWEGVTSARLTEDQALLSRLRDYLNNLEKEIQESANAFFLLELTSLRRGMDISPTNPREELEAEVKKRLEKILETSFQPVSAERFSRLTPSARREAQHLLARREAIGQRIQEWIKELSP